MPSHESARHINHAERNATNSRRDTSAFLLPMVSRLMHDPQADTICNQQAHQYKDEGKAKKGLIEVAKSLYIFE